MKFLRIGICALLVFGVAAHGGVEDWARMVLESGAALLLVAWAFGVYSRREEQIVVPALLLPMGALVLLVFLEWASFHTELAYGTRTELQLLLADAVVLFLTAQAFRTIEDWKQFVWFAMFFSFLVCTFGILQHLTFNGKIYWFREMRFGGIPFGPYANRNHFAAFAELLIPISLLPLLLGKVRRERLFVVGLFTVLQIAALLLSASRGGIVSFGVELLVLVAWLALRRPDGKLLLAGGAILLLVALLVSWIGVRQITQRFSAMQSLEISTGKRASMRRDTWRIFLDHPVFGTGLGTIEAVFPPYDSLYDGKIVNHTHNDYLEALAETGILGGLCCAWFLGVLFSQALPRVRPTQRSFASILQFSALLGCVGFLVHSLVDFNLHIPVNAMLFFVLAFLATAQIAPAAPVEVHLRSRRGNP
ncbi:MAG: O-antigen ligase family protein [Candidatus Acidiferrum sp.]|jgi:O-antigen ligase